MIRVTKIKKIIGIVIFAFSLHCFSQQPVYEDVPFWQDCSESFFLEGSNKIELNSVSIDRNEVIQILSSEGLMIPFKEKIVVDRSYHPMMEMSVSSMKTYKNQFVYLTDKAVLSNAWAGRVYLNHNLANANYFDGDTGFNFLVGSDNGLQYLGKSIKQWNYTFKRKIDLKEIKYDASKNGFWILSSNKLAFYDPSSNEFTQKFTGENLTSFTILENGKEIVLGTNNGYLIYDKTTDKISKENRKLPWNEITCVTEIDGNLWFGSTQGAFMLREDGKFNYYASRRWLADDLVKHISPGTENTVLVLTSKGMSKLIFDKITLEEKAMYFEKQVRQRHIRNGFNSNELVMSEPGDLSTGQMVDSDNDGLWTSMYLASQLFRYAVTKSEDAYQNILESFDAMERLFEINNIKGFPSRSYERYGYFKSDLDRWQDAEDPNWSWKGTTSSDEAIGHYFTLCLIAEIIEDETIKNKAIKRIEQFTDHIVDNDFYLIDADGKPTTWGKWNPDYVNNISKNVGDRKLNSSNIIAFLQAGYHFTGKEKYKKAAYKLMNKYGYLENLKRPMNEIGVVDGADDLSKKLSSDWNHSDDEMYFLAYWYLYPYAFTDDLKNDYKEAIKDHWNFERPEKNGLWNFCYAMTGATDFDLDESVWFLKEYPLDMIAWSITNSHRKDIVLLPENFREQTTKEVLPPDERPSFKHNTNAFVIDRNSGGRIENSGDLFLLPYWMGRYLGVISDPKN